VGDRHVLIAADEADDPGPAPGFLSNAVLPAPTFDIARYGQVFTPPAIVDRMLALSRNIGRNIGRTLDPACGDGAFSARIAGCVAIELDPAHCPPGALNIDFFSYPESEKFATVIGNPPF